MTAKRTLRPATVADVQAIVRVAAACDEPIDAPGVPGSPYAEHLLARGRVIVAEADRVVIGYAAAVDLGRFRHVSDLFVHPGAQGHGVGRLLLGELLVGVSAATTFSSDHPRALPIYLREGMGALWPNLYLEGRASNLPDPDLSVEPVSIEDAAAAEAPIAGIDRILDHRYWGTRRGATPFLVRDGRSVAGVGVAVNRRGRQGRWLPHLAIAADADPVAVVLSAIRATAPGAQAGPQPAAARSVGVDVGDPASSVCVPGPQPALSRLLAAGFRIVDHDTFVATDPSLVDPKRILPDPSLL